ncbi:MAG: STAS/SEC14 domain-containing protein [Flavobacteriaceae bacterium]|nr:STAS/SEC14 domain-containing protein [Flavobacteriaceae bacterium]
MRKRYKLNFGSFEIKNNIIYGYINDGEHIHLERIQELQEIIELHFSNKTFGYISVRNSSYSIDPTIYGFLSELPNLSCFAIVYPDYIGNSNYELEKHFYHGQIRRFQDVEHAADWVMERNSITDFAKDTTP